MEAAMAYTNDEILANLRSHLGQEHVDIRFFSPEKEKLIVSAKPTSPLFGDPIVDRLKRVYAAACDVLADTEGFEKPTAVKMQYAILAERELSHPKLERVTEDVRTTLTAILYVRPVAETIVAAFEKDPEAMRQALTAAGKVPARRV